MFLLLVYYENIAILRKYRSMCSFWWII